MKSTLLIVCIFACLESGLAQSSQSNRDESEVRQTLQNFLTSFDDLDMQRFISFFEEDASIFYPRGTAKRVDGRDAIQSQFTEVFAGIRGRQTHPPYMHIEPRNTGIQLLGEVAIVTFHLDDRPGMLNRRTVILHKTTSGWKIAHLHASEVKYP